MGRASHDAIASTSAAGFSRDPRFWSEFEQIGFVEAPGIGRHELQPNDWFTPSALGEKDAPAG